MRTADKTDKKPKASNISFMRFSGMAFSMAAAIGLFTYLGVWLDGRLASEGRVWTVVGALFGTIVAMYQVIRSLKS
jgi:multisubunit Na+/H+ antiporter MnhG subunit